MNPITNFISGRNKYSGLTLYLCLLAFNSWSERWSSPSIYETSTIGETGRLQASQEKARTEYLNAEVGYLGVGYTTSGSYVKRLVWVGVRGRTNLTAYKPLAPQAFEAQLYNEEGKEIKKTTYGRQFGKALKPDKKLLDGTFRNDKAEMYGHSRELLFERGAGDSHLWDFELIKSFKIKAPGEYRLQITVRLFVKDTNNIFQPLILPPVSKTIKILDEDIE